MIALKGLGYGAKTAADVARLKQMNTDWFYTWGATPNLATDVPGFVPMVWGGGSVANIPTIRNALPVTKADHVLGFNEPDHAGQADMTPWEAFGKWAPIQELALDGLRIGSPAQVTPNGTWINEFITACNQWRKRVDFIAVHSYMNPDARLFVDKIDALYDRLTRPIWITEMGVADWNATATTPNRYSREQVNDFMAEVVPMLKARPFVERFAWKTRASTDPVMGTGALWHTDGSMTSTGRLYASL